MGESAKKRDNKRRRIKPARLPSFLTSLDSSPRSGDETEEIDEDADDADDDDDDDDDEVDDDVFISFPNAPSAVSPRADRPPTSPAHAPGPHDETLAMRSLDGLPSTSGVDAIREFLDEAISMTTPLIDGGRGVDGQSPLPSPPREPFRQSTPLIRRTSPVRSLPGAVSALDFGGLGLEPVARREQEEVRQSVGTSQRQAA